MYSHEAIDSIAFKSANVARNNYQQSPQSSSTSLLSASKVSASEKLVCGLEEALKLITDMLQSSGEVMEQFKSEWDVALSSYQLDIGMIDEAHEKTTTDQKKRKKRAMNSKNNPLASKGKEANHALNFHLASKKESFQCSDDGGDIFILPPDDDEIDIRIVSDNKNKLASSNEKRNNKNNSTDSKRMNTTKKEDQARFDSRSNLITKIQRFREEESLLLKQLHNALPKDDGMTSTLTLRERHDLEDALEKCRSQQTEEVVAIVSKYKPKFSSGKHSGASNDESLGLHLPTIEHILEEATAYVNSNPALDKRRCTPLPSHSFSPSTETKCNKSDNIGDLPAERKQRHKLTRDFTNSSETEAAIVNDADNFVAVHELCITTPSIQTNVGGVSEYANEDDNEDEYSEDEEFESDDLVPMKQSLSELVKCNTHPLNPLNMGRRNRIEKDRRHAKK